MGSKIYYGTVATIFSIIAVLHVLRTVNEWEAVIGGYLVPMWFSWVAVALAGYLAVRGFQLARR